MNLASYISDYLQGKSRVELPNFGVFTTYKKPAEVNQELHKISPPKQVITFTEDDKVFNSELSKYIAEKTGENLFVVQSKIKDEVKKWKDEIFLRNTVVIPNFGEFVKSEDNIILNQFLDSNAIYFGLEEIILKDKKTSEQEHNYVFNHSILWIFLFIFPLGALLYLGLNYSEKLFGKNSFENISANSSTHRIPKKILTIDSAKNNSLEHIKTDSLKSTK